MGTDIRAALHSQRHELQPTPAEPFTPTTIHRLAIDASQTKSVITSIVLELDLFGFYGREPLRLCRPEGNGSSRWIGASSEFAETVVVTEHVPDRTSLRPLIDKPSGQQSERLWIEGGFTVNPDDVDELKTALAVVWTDGEYRWRRRTSKPEDVQLVERPDQ